MAQNETIYLAGGCFWGLEHALKMLDGVKETTVGYVNGQTADPDYEAVCSDTTGYKEAVKVIYDAQVITLEKLLRAFFICITPEQKDGQGYDTGTQYQTGVYYIDPQTAAACARFFAAERLKHPAFFTELEAMHNFYPAETYHQDYLQKNPGGYCHISQREFAAVKALNQEK